MLRGGSVCSRGGRHRRRRLETLNTRIYASLPVNRNTSSIAYGLDPDGVDLCARRLGAQPAYSVKDLGSLRLDGKFGLIWCGSLITHQDSDRIRVLLGMFSRHLGLGVCRLGTRAIAVTQSTGGRGAAT